jgi:hypothetical protein
MAKPRFGRDAQVYIAPAAYTEGVLDELDIGDLVRVAATKDINVTHEASQMTASSRDWEYDVHAQGPKNYTIEFERNITLEEDGDDAEILREAYNDGTDIWVLVTRAARMSESGPGILFIGQVFGKPENSPQADGAALMTITIRQANPDQEPEDVVTPWGDPFFSTVPGDVSGVDTDPLGLSGNIEISMNGSLDDIDFQLVSSIEGTLVDESMVTLVGVNADIVAGTLDPAITAGVHTITIRVRRNGQTDWSDTKTFTATITEPE